jgi:hypothetical protein
MNPSKGSMRLGLILNTRSTPTLNTLHGESPVTRSQDTFTISTEDKPSSIFPLPLSEDKSKTITFSLPRKCGTGKPKTEKSVGTQAK